MLPGKRDLTFGTKLACKFENGEMDGLKFSERDTRENVSFCAKSEMEEIK